MTKPDALATESAWEDAKTAIRAVLADVARPRTVITYVALVARLPVLGLTPNDPRLGRLLGETSAAEDDAGRGLLSVAVVRQDTGLPGVGFFRMAERRGREVRTQTAFWGRELERVYAAWAAPEQQRAS